jgi:glycerol dehydrogenase-like iron-containing ADH family enzyme
MSNNVFFPSYTIGDDAFDKIPEICARYGKTAVLIGGKTALSKVQDTVTALLEESGFTLLDTLWYGGDSTLENVNLLLASPSVQEADMIFAAGGGRALDTCKMTAHALRKPFFTLPTIASTCAACTSLGVQYYPDGQFRGVHASAYPANHIFISPKIIAEAPIEYIWAGLGDTMAKYYESVVSTRLLELDHSDALGITISKMSAEPLFAYAADGLADARQGKTSRAFEQTILAIIISTGLVSNLAEHNYNTGLAHAIYFGLVALGKRKEKHLHGEIVGYGILPLLLLDKQRDEFERVYHFNKSVGLPTCLADMDVTEKEDIDIVIHTAANTPDLDIWPYKVSEEMVRDAVMELEEYNNNN